MSEPELKVGDLVGGSLQVVRCDSGGLVLKSPAIAFLGCGFAGLALLLLAAVTWFGVAAAAKEKTLQDALFSTGGKAALVYSVAGVLGVMCLGLIQSWTVDAAGRTLTRASAFGLRPTTWSAADLRLTFAIGELDEGGAEPCRLLVYGSAEEPVATLGVMAASSDDAARLLRDGRHIAALLGLTLEVKGEPKAACDALAEALRSPDA